NIATLAYHEDQSDGRESQAKVLGIGLRGPGADSRTAKTHGRANRPAIWAGANRAHAGANGKRAKSARAAGETTGGARSDLFDQHPRSRRPHLRQGIARSQAGV